MCCPQPTIIQVLGTGAPAFILMHATFDVECLSRFAPPLCHPRFAHTHSHTQHTHTLKVYESLALPLVRSAMEGVNAAIIAYGQVRLASIETPIFMCRKGARYDKEAFLNAFSMIN